MKLMKNIFYACQFRSHDDNKSARQRPRTAAARALVKPNGRMDGGRRGRNANDGRTDVAEWEGRKEEGEEGSCNRRHLARTSMLCSFATSKSTDGRSSCGPISD